MITTYFNSLSTHIVNSIPNCVHHVGYGRELNSYPAISILRPDSADYQSNIRHLADGTKIYIVRCMIRAYSCGSLETAIDTCEELVRQIEECLPLFRRSYAITQLGQALSTQDLDALSTEDLIVLCIQDRRSYIDDVRVLTVDTDEGLNAPYGIGDLEVEMIYVTP